MRKFSIIILCILFGLSFGQSSNDCEILTSGESEILESPNVLFASCSERIILSRENLKKIQFATNLYFKNITFNEIQGNAFDDLKNLTSLSIVQSNLSELNKWSAIELFQMESIDLQSNQIWFIAGSCLTSYPKLSTINLSRNRLRILNNETFFGAYQLEVIDLSQNQLQKIDEFTFEFQLRLKELNLSRNLLNYVDEFAFSTTTKIEVLDLSENKLNFIGANLFYNLIQLKKLVLKGNELKFLLPNMFSGNTALNSIDLSWNRITDMHEHSLNGLENVKVNKRIKFYYSFVCFAH